MNYKDYFIETLYLMSYNEIIWMIIGFLGQTIFFSRWLVQWIYSEKYGKSTIPISFWWLSFFGGLITFFYAFNIKSFPFMFAQFIGLIVYIRNLYLLLSKKNLKKNDK